MNQEPVTFVATRDKLLIVPLAKRNREDYFDKSNCNMCRVIANKNNSNSNNVQ